MIYRLRKKFIRICTLSFLAVFLALFCCIYLTTYLQTTRSLDDLADILSENDGSFPNVQTFSPHGGQSQLPAEQNPETPFTTRFFTVRFDAQGEVLSTDIQSIASVTQEEAADYGEQALHKGSERGWVGSYRFKVTASSQETVVVCVSGTSALGMNRNFLTTASLVFVGGSLVVLLLVTLFSRRAVKPVAESYERQKQFVTDANHQLKTPLTLIRANLDILEGETGPSEWLSDIREETELMSQMVGKLVALARMDEEAAPLETRPFDLAEAVADGVSFFAPVAEQAGKSLEAQVPPRPGVQGGRRRHPPADFHPAGQRGEILRPGREHPGDPDRRKASGPVGRQHLCPGGGPSPLPAVRPLLPRRPGQDLRQRVRGGALHCQRDCGKAPGRNFRPEAGRPGHPFPGEAVKTGPGPPPRERTWSCRFFYEEKSCQLLEASTQLYWLPD